MTSTRSDTLPARRELHPAVRWLRRTGAIWVIEVFGFLAIAWLSPWIQVARWTDAFLFIALVGVVNAVLWPMLAQITLPFMVFTFGFLSFALNGLIFWISGFLIAGIHFANYFWALVAAVGVAVTNTILASLLTIDEDASFYRGVLDRRFHMRRPDPEIPGYPGVVFLEIDGCSEHIFRKAIAAGFMPTMARWLGSGSHQIVGWESDLSCQTGAAQAGILHGYNRDIPAFRWVEKSAGGRIMTTTGTRDALDIERRISNGQGLLAHKGCSRSNLFTGDAKDSILTYSSLGDLTRFYAPSYYIFFSNPYNFTRSLVLAAADMVREVYQRWRQIRLDIRPRLIERRRGLYPLVRAAATVLLRDMTVYTVIGDILGGEADVVYATFVAYDEVAHHSGVEDRDALQVLGQLDRSFSRIERAAQEAKRAYQIVVLSDHGQSKGATFRQRYGLTLRDLIGQLLPDEVTIYAQLDTNEDWSHVGALVTDAASNDQRLLGRFVRRATRTRVTEGGQIAVGPEHVRRKRERLGKTIPAAEAQIIVLASGNLGLVYFLDWHARMTREQIDEAFPGLLDGLVGHSGIGFAMVRSAQAGAVVLGARGQHWLEKHQVEGEDPLAPFCAHAARHLLRTDNFRNAPDILVNSFYDPEKDEAAAFEELIGFHGGLGGNQSKPFIFCPFAWGVHRQERIVGAEQRYTLLKAQLAVLAGDRDANHAG